MDWTEWNADASSVCPVSKDALVDVKLRGGRVVHERRAKLLRWYSDENGWGSHDDIIAYRLVNVDQPKPDQMTLYCDNFVALARALADSRADFSNILSHSHEFLDSLAKSNVKIDARYLQNSYD
jgi:hypothetical protein